MVKAEKTYLMYVHYPDSEEAKRNLRNHMGTAYVKFIKTYILNLTIEDEDKNKLYSEVMRRLIARK